METIAFAVIGHPVEYPGGRPITSLMVGSLAEAIEEYFVYGHCPESTKTYWVDVHRGDGYSILDESTFLTSIQVGPTAPPCRSGHEHEWADGPVHPSGCGTVSEYECEFCGLKRIEDSGATRPDTGDRFFSVEYR